LNPDREFGGKTSECDFAKKMKDKFKIVKKPCGYSTTLISDPAIKVSM